MNKSGKDLISKIEKRIVELKYLERDIIKERDIIRFRVLDRAERSPRVKQLINDFFFSIMKISPEEIRVNAAPSKFTGRQMEEHISEIKVSLSSETRGEMTGIILNVFLENSFSDPETESEESILMDKLTEIREEVKSLREKKALSRGSV